VEIKLSYKLVVFLQRILIFLALLCLPSYSQADRSGKEVYDQLCAACHGVNMEGGQAGSFIDGVWNYGSGPSYHRRNIAFGIVGTPMVPWSTVLTDPEIVAVVEYILAVEAELKIEPPPPPDRFDTEHYRLKIDVLAEGLNQPWGIAFLDERTAVFTEHQGNLRLLVDQQVVDQPIANTPQAMIQPNGDRKGYLDIAADPNYAENGWIYLVYAHEAENLVENEEIKRSMVRVVRGRIKDMEWLDEEIIYSAPENSYTLVRDHYGSRLVFDREGYLYFSVGDRHLMIQAQNLGRPEGKFHRIHPDGRIADSNPFSAMLLTGALPTIFAYGSRNAQGLAMHPVTGEIWSSEHGPMGGDELNKVVKGINMGWPVITMGLHSDNTLLTPYKEREGMAQPMKYWIPSPALSAIEFSTSPLFPKWQNNLLLASLKHKNIRRLIINGDQVTEAEFVLKGCGRIRDITTGPDGALYVLVDRRGFILRLTPEGVLD